MSNIRGGAATLTASFARLTDSDDGSNKWVTIRSAPGNDIMYFSHDGSTTIGFLYAGEAKTFENVQPEDIYVKGTVSDTVYWDLQG